MPVDSKVDKTKQIDEVFTSNQSIEAIVTFFCLKQLEVLNAIYDELVMLNDKTK